MCPRARRDPIRSSSEAGSPPGEGRRAALDERAGSQRIRLLWFTWPLIDRQIRGATAHSGMSSKDDSAA